MIDIQALGKLTTDNLFIEVDSVKSFCRSFQKEICDSESIIYF